jgi:GTPase SAR1 family protein
MGAVIVFSVADRISFGNLKKWIEELREHTMDNLV